MNERRCTVCDEWVADYLFDEDEEICYTCITESGDDFYELE